MTKLKAELQILHSKSGTPYAGCLVAGSEIRKYLEALRELIGDDFEQYSENRRARDGEHYHITVLNTREFGKLEHQIVQEGIMLGFEFEFQLLGLGHANDGTNQTYFVVAESSEAETLRSNLHLKKRDFHITLGFRDVDLHSVQKNRQSLIPIRSSHRFRQRF